MDRKIKMDNRVDCIGYQIPESGERGLMEFGLVLGGGFLEGNFSLCWFGLDMVGEWGWVWAWGGIELGVGGDG